jgi:hypothetical protein
MKIILGDIHVTAIADAISAQLPKQIRFTIDEINENYLKAEITTSTGTPEERLIQYLERTELGNIYNGFLHISRVSDMLATLIQIPPHHMKALRDKLVAEKKITVGRAGSYLNIYYSRPYTAP